MDVFFLQDAEILLPVQPLYMNTGPCMIMTSIHGHKNIIPDSQDPFFILLHSVYSVHHSFKLSELIS